MHTAAASSTHGLQRHEGRQQANTARGGSGPLPPGGGLTAARAVVIAWLSASGKQRLAMYKCVAPSSTPAGIRLQPAACSLTQGCSLDTHGRSLCHMGSQRGHIRLQPRRIGLQPLVRRVAAVELTGLCGVCMEQVEPRRLLRVNQPGAQRVCSRGLGECSTLCYQLDAARLLGLGLGFGVRGKG